jgi:hypothetical protein
MYATEKSENKTPITAINTYKAILGKGCDDDLPI